MGSKGIVNVKIFYYSGLEEAEAALEQEENKVLRAQLEMSQVRQEIDRRIQEKEEEFDHARKNHQRAVESIQASIEAEARTKEEALRVKKKHEADINEMEIALDHANKAHSESKKVIKRTHMQLVDVNAAIEEERKIKTEVLEQYGLTERKANALISSPFQKDWVARCLKPKTCPSRYFSFTRWCIQAGQRY